MILQFPDLDTLHLALTSGAVPAAVSLAPTAAGFDDQGRVWLQPSAAPSRAALAELRRLNVQTPRTSPVPLTEQCHSWLQLLPVTREGGRVVPVDQTPVLFDLAAGQFSAVATEILRLGNDRQSFRYLEAKDGDRVLLRVIGPPYYTLLRALDPDGADAPVAFVECAPRAWVQVGHTHPFARQLKVPEGKLLLLQPPRQWTFLPDAPFRELYEVLDFVLPNSRSAWSEGEVAHKLRVPLRLVPGDPGEVDELWVLRDRPLEQLDDLVGNASDDVLHKLSFAVAEKDGRTLLVLRVRPSKGPAPAPVLDAVRFRTYQKLPNLFVPSGKRLHPPLSRHVIRRLLAEDPAVITWLYPQADGTFTPETLPDEAFRPLTDWIDYVLDHDRQALQTWVQSAQFDFEPFVCDEEAPKPKKPPAGGREKKGTREKSGMGGGQDDVQAFAARAAEQGLDAPLVVEEFAELPRAEPSVLQQQLRALEERFLAVEGPLDSPERLALWPEMARLNAALGLGDDAGLCWLNALWADAVPAATASWNWVRAEASRVARDGVGAQGHSWAAAAAGSAKPHDVDGTDLDRVLALEEPTSADVRTLAAYVFWAAGRQPAPAALLQRLPRVRHFLETYEQRLPVRASWLGAVGLTRLAGGDVLGLARARDRILERLYQNGLRPEQDLAPFLHASGQRSGERLRAFRHWLVGLSDLAQEWLKRLPLEYNEQSAVTPPYADLIFSYGLARLGETEASNRLLLRATAALETKDDVHRVLLGYFAHQIKEAQAGKAHGALPKTLLDEPEKVQDLQRYLIARLRQYSRILEPNQKIDAAQHNRPSSPLDEVLVALSNEDDRETAEQLEQKALALAAGEPLQEAQVLKSGLAVAPRFGEDFALRRLVQTVRVLDALPPAEDEEAIRVQAQLLESALRPAAHFDQLDHVQALVGRFHKLLESLEGRAGALRTIHELAGQAFRGLRKFGFREEIDRLLHKMHDLALASQQAPSLQALLKRSPKDQGDAKGFDEWVAALLALLPLAGGWYYFGRDAEAEPVLDAVRGVLFQGRLLVLHRKQDQMRLACEYLTAVAQAPVPEAQRRIEEFFRRADVRDGWTTASHFALAKLRPIETAVMGVVADNGTLGGEVRRWLDEDEFLVRRRVHRDLRDTLAHSER